jgi:hypothetical protein
MCRVVVLGSTSWTTSERFNFRPGDDLDGRYIHLSLMSTPASVRLATLRSNETISAGDPGNERLLSTVRRSDHIRDNDCNAEVARSQPPRICNLCFIGGHFYSRWFWLRRRREPPNDLPVKRVQPIANLSVLDSTDKSEKHQLLHGSWKRTLDDSDNLA